MLKIQPLRLLWLVLPVSAQLPNNTMPFKSKAQSRACFASGGFDGSVDCMKWAKSTQYKKLPARVKKPKKK